MPDSTSTFCNPYTFIPISRSSRIYSSDEEAAELTGLIHCTLEAKRPIVIPGHQNEEDSVVPFYRALGAPAIPGSTLRGCFRSVFEAVTNSCVRTSRKHLSSVSGLRSPGLLERGEDGTYVLWEARRYRVKDEGLVKGKRTGDEIAFDGKVSSNGAGAVKATGDGCSQTGWFLHVSPLNGNHSSIFERGSRSWMVDGRYVSCLRENVEIYCGKNKEREGDAAKAKNPFADEYRSCLERMERGDGPLPVWYGMQGEDEAPCVQLSWAQVSRSVFPVSPADLVSKLGLSPCSAKETACPACDLFGFVAEGGVCAASHVRFSDAALLPGRHATFVKDSDGLDPYLPPLMEPRPSAFEMYLRNERSPHTFTPESEGTELAGRKGYWHHRGPVRWGRAKVTEGGVALNHRFEVLEAGAEFGFDVYFEDVTRRQLNLLVWALTFGQSWTGKDNLWHLVGHGRPVGLGSVLVRVEDVRVRTVDSEGYHLSDDDAWRMDLAMVQAMLDRRATDAILKVADSEAISPGLAVDYPRMSEDGDIFEWFAANRDLFVRGSGLPVYGVTLPAPTSPRALPTDPAPALKEAQGKSQANVAVVTRQEGTLSSVKNRDKPNLSFGMVKWVAESGATWNLGCHHNNSPNADPDVWQQGMRDGARVSFEIVKDLKSGKDCAGNVEFL